MKLEVKHRNCHLLLSDFRDIFFCHISYKKTHFQTLSHKPHTKHDQPGYI